MSNLLKGEWSLIQWNPDIATSELLNIGVVFNHDGQSYFKMLDNFGRVACLYDERTAQHLKDTIDLSLEFFGNNLFEFSDQIRVLPIGTAKGVNENKILDRLYGRVVSLGKVHEEIRRKRSEFSIVKNDYFLKRATKNLRQTLNGSDGLKDLLNLFPKDSYIQKDGSNFYVPIRSQSSYGSLVSVVSNNIDTINSNYLTLATDLLTAAQLDHKSPNFFVLKPSATELQKLDEDKANIVGEALDKLDYKFEKYGFRIESADSEDELNDRMISWMKKQAA
ncbi:hypothetical protein [Acinetobacter bereziniae]|uniref:hypothetical protein n=1 Tax=Acinetobacter bereziniae TaxID=106648 RepID=UPI002954EF75|nr:hypothetical protein [Acinetobacter bereziniae]MDV8157471.1 hypothetical protein [Acinetobacter bereziniae]